MTTETNDFVTYGVLKSENYAYTYQHDCQTDGYADGGNANGRARNLVFPVLTGVDVF